MEVWVQLLQSKEVVDQGRIHRRTFFSWLSSKTLSQIFLRTNTWKSINLANHSVNLFNTKCQYSTTTRNLKMIQWTRWKSKLPKKHTNSNMVRVLKTNSKKKLTRSWNLLKIWVFHSIDSISIGLPKMSS